MSPVIEKFLRYVSYDTQSMDEQPQIPSTEKQRILANVLAEELRTMGAKYVQVSDQSYVYATIPATTKKQVPVLGLIAHMDTSPDASGKDVKPRIVERYDGSVIVLNEEKKKIFTAAKDFLNAKYGQGTVEIEIKDSYYNMKKKIEPHMYLIEIAQKAMEQKDVAAAVVPIRGGTDGARLSYMGLPCPNICTGGENYHGVHEYVCIQSMEKIVEILVEIIKIFGEIKA